MVPMFRNCFFFFMAPLFCDCLILFYASNFMCSLIICFLCLVDVPNLKISSFSGLIAFFLIHLFLNILVIFAEI